MAEFWKSTAMIAWAMGQFVACLITLLAIVGVGFGVTAIAPWDWIGIVAGAATIPFALGGLLAFGAWWDRLGARIDG